MATETEVGDVLFKLEKIKEIRARTSQVERLRAALRAEYEASAAEEKCLSEYERERELLQQERMAHVEELRLIHADINSLEDTIKAAQQEKARAMENAKRLYEEYRPLKMEVDQLRMNVGLDHLPDMHDGDNFSPEMLERQKQEYVPETHPDPPPAPSHPAHHHHPSPQHTPSSSSSHAPPPVPMPPQPHPFLSVSVSAAAQTHPRGPPSMLKAPDPPRPPPTAFRQQPPPMKQCLSCHQQIHRNAPICPLCKAKSRSRNPKKPKRKLDE